MRRRGFLLGSLLALIKPDKVDAAKPDTQFRWDKQELRIGWQGAIASVEIPQVESTADAVALLGEVDTVSLINWSTKVRASLAARKYMCSSGVPLVAHPLDPEELRQLMIDGLRLRRQK